MKKLLFIVFRFILGIYIILIGIKGLSEINTNKVRLVNTVERFELSIQIPYNLSINLHLLKQYPIEILYFENLCLIYGGFLTLCGFSMAKAFVMCGLLVEFVFLNNITFFRDEKTVLNFSLLLSILGGVLSIK
jgi:hypothetical protein